MILFCLLTGEVPFDIANSSDEAFFLFQGKGFDFLRESLHEVKAEPGAICRQVYRVMKCRFAREDARGRSVKTHLLPRA